MDQERNQQEAETALARAIPVRASGAAWEEPLDAFGAYRVGEVVTHGPSTWVNIRPFNVAEPGDGWRAVPTEASGYPQFEAETAYGVGDRVLWIDGSVQEVVNESGTLFSPGDVPEDWQTVDPNSKPVEPDETVTPAEWTPGGVYVRGQSVVFDGVEYRVKDSHTAQSHWPPEQATLLYEQVFSWSQQ